MKKQIKIFVCCHSFYGYIPPFGIPIQCGAVLNPPISGTVSDFGKHGSISHKNKEYCELTALYYAWKNVSADYYGFCHYRRFFSADTSFNKPYLAFGKLSDKKKDKLLGTEAEIEALIDDCDIIVPRCENMGQSVYEYYCNSNHHFREDLDIFLEILYSRFPFLSEYARKYLEQKRQYFCNMFIMKSCWFTHYCEILFEILQKFDECKRLHGSFKDDRTDGFLAERFVGIFLYYALEKGAKIKETVRIDTNCSLRKRLLVRLFPPETSIRFKAKKIMRYSTDKRKC